MNVMKRKFTLREIILLLILVALLFVGLYFFLVYYPMQNKINEVKEEQEQVLIDTELADAKLEVYNSMKEAIAEIEKIPEDQRTRMYKHTDEERRRIKDNLDRIFKNNTVNYSFYFGTVTQEGNVVQRPIRFSFDVPVSEGSDSAYNKCKTILYELTHMEHRRVQISNISLSPANGSVETDELSVSGTITFYELA